MDNRLIDTCVVSY